MVKKYEGKPSIYIALIIFIVKKCSNIQCSFVAGHFHIFTKPKRFLYNANSGYCKL